MSMAPTPRRGRLLVRGIGEPAEDLEIGDQRIHLGGRTRIAVERRDLRRLAVALGHAAGDGRPGFACPTASAVALAIISSV